jgi:predicted component of type VI protein secretion system
VRAAPIGPLAQLETAQRLRPETRVRMRDHLAARIEPQQDGTLRLVSRAGALTMTAAEADALRELLDGETVPADLIGMELAARLLRAGLAVPDF